MYHSSDKTSSSLIFQRAEFYYFSFLAKKHQEILIFFDILCGSLRFTLDDTYKQF